MSSTPHFTPTDHCVSRVTSGSPATKGKVNSYLQSLSPYILTLLSHFPSLKTTHILLLIFMVFTFFDLFCSFFHFQIQQHFIEALLCAATVLGAGDTGVISCFPGAHVLVEKQTRGGEMSLGEGGRMEDLRWGADFRLLLCWAFIISCHSFILNAFCVF